MDQLLSSIKVLDSGLVYPFERPAEAVALPEDVLHHPFLVTEIDDDRYLLLEDTALFERLVSSGVSHLPVLLCAPDELRIHCPTLVLTEFTEQELRHLTVRHPDQICLETPGNVASFHQVHVTFPGRATQTIYLRHSSQTGCSAALDHLFAAVGDGGKYFPLRLAVNDADPLVRFNTGGTLLTIPDATLSDLRGAAMSGNLYPPGIIAVQPLMRVYNIDVPMTILRAEGTIDDKSTFLRELIALRLQSQRACQFSGQVYILNR